MSLSIPLRPLRAAAAGAVTLAMMVGGAPPARAAEVSEPVVDGLVGPLGLAVGTDGTLYIAEAFAGRLTSVDKKGRRQVLAQTEAFVGGVDASGKGQTVFTTTLFPEEGAAADTTLSRVTPQGKTSTLASLQAYEEAVNPDEGSVYGFVDASEECLEQAPPFTHPYGGIIESNPYAVTIVPGGYLVADAAANAILKVGANGRISTVAVLPPVPQEIDADTAEQFGMPACAGEVYLSEPVPTDVEVGPDGSYYVSSLPGMPELPGTGSVWRIDPRVGEPELVAGGLTGAVDLAVAPDGAIYVAELFADRISVLRDGAVSPLVELSSPGAVEIARDGTLYATTGVFDPEGNGSVVMITP